MKYLLCLAAFISSTLSAKDFKPEDNWLPIEHIDYQCVGERPDGDETMKFALGINVAKEAVYEAIVGSNGKINYYLEFPVKKFNVYRCLDCYDVLIAEDTQSLHLQLRGKTMNWVFIEDGKKTSLTLKCQRI